MHSLTRMHPQAIKVRVEIQPHAMRVEPFHLHALLRLLAAPLDAQLLDVHVRGVARGVLDPARGPLLLLEGAQLARIDLAAGAVHGRERAAEGRVRRARVLHVLADLAAQVAARVEDGHRVLVLAGERDAADVEPLVVLAAPLALLGLGVVGLRAVGSGLFAGGLRAVGVGFLRRTLRGGLRFLGRCVRVFVSGGGTALLARGLGTWCAALPLRGYGH